MDDLGALRLAFCGAVVVLAYAIRSTAGFGGAVAAVPLLTLVLPLPVVVSAISALTLFASIGQGRAAWRHVVWREILRAAPPTLAGVVAAVLIFRRVELQTLTRAFGAFVVAYAIFALTAGGRIGEPPARWVWPIAVVTCALAGFIAMLFGGSAGPFYVMYLNALRLAKDHFRATITVILFALAAMRVAGYASLGFYDMRVALLVLAGIPLMAAGSWLGNRIAGRIEQRLFSRVVGALLLASGVALLLR